RACIRVADVVDSGRAGVAVVTHRGPLQGDAGTLGDGQRAHHREVVDHGWWNIVPFQRKGCDAGVPVEASVRRDVLVDVPEGTRVRRVRVHDGIVSPAGEPTGLHTRPLENRRFGDVEDAC